MLSRSQAQTGFTLVEMVMVIVIIGILGVGIVNFIGRSTQGYADMAERQQMATVGWIVSEKITRAVRDALPNSFRENDSCIEFIPTVTGTDYLSIPVLTGANNFDVIRFNNYTTPGANDRIAVYPTITTDVYDLSANGVVSDTIDSIADAALADTQTITLDSSHQFPTDSPNRRLFVVQNPEMYCFVGTQLRRYTEHGYDTTMHAPADAGNFTVIGTQLSNGSFTYDPGTLSRNGVVTFAFDVVAGSGDTHPISQEVQIRNVP